MDFFFNPHKVGGWAGRVPERNEMRGTVAPGFASGRHAFVHPLFEKVDLPPWPRGNAGHAATNRRGERDSPTVVPLRQSLRQGNDKNLNRSPHALIKIREFVMKGYQVLSSTGAKDLLGQK
jgi:hypothetical protein